MFLGFLTGLWLAPWFVVLCLVAFCGAYWASEENDADGFGIIIGLAFAVFLFFATEPWGAVYGWIKNNSGATLAFFVMYFIAGTVYSIFKWWRYLAAKINKYKDDVANGERWTDLDAFIKHLPSAKDRKAIIFMWIMYWPLSLVWLILNDPLTHLVKFIIAKCDGLYNRISAAMINDLKQQAGK